MAVWTGGTQGAARLLPKIAVLTGTLACVAGAREPDLDIRTGSRVCYVAFSPDGKLLASGSFHGKDVQLWDVGTARRAATFVGHDGDVWDVAFGPDGKTLVSASEDETVRLWDVATGRCRRTLQGTDWMGEIAFSPDGALLAAASSKRGVELWDVAKGQKLDIFVGHAGLVVSVAFSPDGTLLARGASDNTIKLWNVATRKGLPRCAAIPIM